MEIAVINIETVGHFWKICCDRGDISFNFNEQYPASWEKIRSDLDQGFRDGTFAYESQRSVANDRAKRLFDNSFPNLANVGSYTVRSSSLPVVLTYVVGKCSPHSINLYLRGNYVGYLCLNVCSPSGEDDPIAYDIILQKVLLLTYAEAEVWKNANLIAAYHRVHLRLNRYTNLVEEV